MADNTLTLNSTDTTNEHRREIFAKLTTNKIAVITGGSLFNPPKQNELENTLTSRTFCEQPI